MTPERTHILRYVAPGQPEPLADVERWLGREPCSGRAMLIAVMAHKGQFRRDGVTPYIEHPKAVVEKLASESDAVQAAAWLHDVLEDTPVTTGELRGVGIIPEVIEAVELLTKRKGVGYTDYLAGVRGNEIARKVKIADMLHNLSDGPTERQIVKYAKGLLYLQNVELSDGTK